MPPQDAADNEQVTPEDWLRANLPATTVSGISVAYVESGSGYPSKFYSIAWLAEQFGDIISSTDDPRQQLVDACGETAPDYLRPLFEEAGR